MTWRTRSTSDGGSLSGRCPSARALEPQIIAHQATSGTPPVTHRRGIGGVRPLPLGSPPLVVNVALIGTPNARTRRREGRVAGVPPIAGPMSRTGEPEGAAIATGRVMAPLTRPQMETLRPLVRAHASAARVMAPRAKPDARPPKSRPITRPRPVSAVEGRPPPSHPAAPVAAIKNPAQSSARKVEAVGAARLRRAPRVTVGAAPIMEPLPAPPRVLVPGPARMERGCG